MRPLTEQSFLSLGPGPSFYLALLHEFQPRLKTGIFSGDRVENIGGSHSTLAICARGLLPFASSRGETMDNSIFSILAAYIGYMRGESGLVDLATAAYTQALGRFRVQIGQMVQISGPSQVQASAQSFWICLTMAFQLFEVSRILLSRIKCLTLPIQ